MRISTGPFVLIAVALSLTACGGGGAAVIDNSGKALTDADLELAYRQSTNADASSFSEQVTFRMLLDDGTKGYARFAVSNVASAGGRGELRVSFWFPDRSVGKTIRMDKGKWTSGGGQFDVSLGDSNVKMGVSESTITMRSDTMDADLTFTSKIAPMRPEGGSADFGAGKYYQTTLISPRARVEGTVTVKDGEGAPHEREIKGWTIIEHRAGNVAPYAMAKRWINVQGIEDEGTLVLSAFERTEKLGGKVQGWMVYATDEGYSVYAPQIQLTPDKLERDADSGYSVPQALIIQSPNGVKGAVKAGEQTRKKDDLANLSKVERFVVEKLMRPWSFTYDSKFVVKAPGEGDSGELTLKGDADFTYQQLK